MIVVSNRKYLMGNICPVKSLRDRFPSHSERLLAGSINSPSSAMFFVIVPFGFSPFWDAPCTAEPSL